MRLEGYPLAYKVSPAFEQGGAGVIVRAVTLISKLLCAIIHQGKKMIVAEDLTLRSTCES